MSEPLDTQAGQGDAAERAASQYMNELAVRLLGSLDAGAPESAPVGEDAEPAPQDSTPSTSAAPHTNNAQELGAATAASIDRFMASIRAHLDLPPDWADPSGTRRRAHDWSYDQVCENVRRVIAEYIRGRAVLTTVRCLHASVAQKSYGTEKRFLCPPPAVHITGPLRHRHSEPSLYMQVQGEDGESLSGEQVVLLDDTSHARFSELYVTGTGKSKNFRLHLHLLSPRVRMHAAKRIKATHTDTRSWATFDSAPIGIISKPSKKTAKARNAAAHIGGNALVALFNRINSQTIRTKYLHSDGGRLSAQSRTWSAFRLVIISPQDGTDDSVLTYGSTVVLVAADSGASTEPLVVCKVDRGRIIPTAGNEHATQDDSDESSPYGTVTQMQKVAFMRLQGDGPARHYLCAGAPLHADAPLEEAHSLPLAFAPPAATQSLGDAGGIVDLVDDTFSWTLVGISHFEYSFIDVDTLDIAGDIAGLALTPFPIVTTMPFYDVQTHKLATSVQHFYYAHDAPRLQPLEVWLGPLGPLPLALQRRPERADETEIAVQLPELGDLLGARAPNADPSECILPLLFVRSIDGAVYHSGRNVVCQDLVALVSAAGDVSAANALKKLNVGLGERAGAHKVRGGAWTIRIV